MALELGSSLRSKVAVFALASSLLASVFAGCRGVPVHRFNARKPRATSVTLPASSSPPSSEPDAGGAVEPEPPPPQPPPPELPLSDTVALSSGDFWLGADGKDTREHLPKRRVAVPAFILDRREVTAQAYAACVAEGRCTPAKTGGECTGGDPEKRDHPINCVTWAQAVAFCASTGARLPTEIEWERAARGADALVWPWGDAWPPPAGVGNFADDSARKAFPFWTTLEGYDDGHAATAPVGSFPRGASPEGILDTAGNVREWTADFFAASPGAKPVAGQELRVVRGSSYGQHKRPELNLFHRTGYRADTWSVHIGFRCAR